MRIVIKSSATAATHQVLLISEIIPMIAQPQAPERPKKLRLNREGNSMASLDWSQCPAVESIPGKRSGAWVFRGTRTPVSTVFENLEDMSVDELIEEFGVTREQVQAVLEFAAQSAEAPQPRR
jgi:uncharacterized protein (DUF433 family)